MNGRHWLAVPLLAVLVSLPGCSCRPSCKQVGAACGAHDECCSFGCGDLLGSNPGVCACNPVPGGVCSTSQDCCSGLRCAQGACEVGCRPADDFCSSASQCCSGTCTDGRCAPREGCADQGQSCQSSNDCCAGLQCPSGTCQPAPCRTATSSCTASNECCSGLGCPAGTCVSGCRTTGQTCAQDNDCCSGGSAGPMRCRGNPDSGTAPECYSGCGQLGYPCSQSSECCTNLRCNQNGQCDRGQLGDSCATTLECESPLVCSPIDNRCHYATCQDFPGSSDCASGLDCCSMACEPRLPDGGNLTCCLPAGVGCSAAYQCCDGNRCLSATGQCGACLQAGASCGSSTDCCSGFCNGGLCRNPAGGECDAGFQCSTNNCGASGQCCHLLGTFCGSGASAGPCCTGVCNQSYCCIPEGQACSGTGNCCGGQCVGGTCCRPISYACTDDAQCCSGDCNDTTGLCQCSAPGDVCRFGSDCCGNSSGLSSCSAAGTCCSNGGGACSGPSDCCAGTSCALPSDGGVGTCCLPAGATCTASSTCCNGACRGNGTCP